MLNSFFFIAQHQRGNSQPAHQRGNSQPRTFVRDVMAAVRASLPSSLLDGTIRQGFNPLLPDSHHTCSHDVTLRIPKQTSHFEGFLTRAHVLCPSVTCVVRSANRTPCAGHVEFHTHAHLENPSIPNPFNQPSFCPSAGSATSTAYVSRPGFTRAAAHVAASCAARPETRARRRANPARSPIQLRPLLGLCPLSDAVVISIQPTHTCVSRRLHTTS